MVFPHCEYWKYNAVYHFWSSLDIQESSEDVGFLFMCSLYIWFSFTDQKTLAMFGINWNYAQLELCPTPLHSQMRTLLFLGAPQTPHYQFYINLSEWKNEFRWVYGMITQGAHSLTLVGFPLGWCLDIKDSFINLFI